MEGNIGFIGNLTGEISGDGGGGVTPHVTATAQVDANTGTPTVTVTRTGTDENPNFNFAFQNLRGERGEAGSQGIQGIPGQTGATGPQGPRGFTGNTGATGPQGEPGESPVVSASATIDSSVGTPSVSVTKTGPQLQPNFAFEFHNLKGEPGADSTVPGPAGPQGPEGPAGVGVAQGGTQGQFLKKAGAGDYLTEWGDIAAGEVSYDNTTSGMAETDVQGAIDSLSNSLTNNVLTPLTDTARVYSMGGGIIQIGSLGIIQWYVKAKSSASNSPIIKTFSAFKPKGVDVALSCIDITSGITSAITSSIPCGIGTGGQVVMKEMTQDHLYAISGTFIVA